MQEIFKNLLVVRAFVWARITGKKALELCRGNVLDVGCGSGIHSLFLQDKGLNVKAIDISEGAVSVSKQRGVSRVEQRSVLDESSCRLHYISLVVIFRM